MVTAANLALHATGTCLLRAMNLDSLFISIKAGTVVMCGGGGEEGGGDTHLHIGLIAEHYSCLNCIE